MNKALIVSACSALLLFASSPGIRPRTDAADYPAHQAAADFSLGAVAIPASQVKKIFATDINKAGYLVIEVGVYPAPGREVDLSPNDFTLLTGSEGAALRPVDGDTVANVLERKDEPRPAARGPHDIYTTTGVTVGHSTYPDPVTGRRTGVITDAGVGIGGPPPGGRDPSSYPPYPSSTSPIQKAHQMEQELWERSLPDGKTTRAVAGYLYFPKPSGKAKDGAWDLLYDSPAGRVKLVLTH